MLGLSFNYRFFISFTPHILINCSDKRSLRLGPDLVGSTLISIVLWVVVAGVIELTVVVLSIQVASNSVGNSKEVGHVLGVGEVLVKVVLEILRCSSIIPRTRCCDRDDC